MFWTVAKVDGKNTCTKRNFPTTTVIHINRERERERETKKDFISSDKIDKIMRI